MDDNTITIDDERLVNDIMSYCCLNGINDVKKFTTKLLKSTFTTEKYGFKPQIESNNSYSSVDNEEKIETASLRDVTAKRSEENEIATTTTIPIITEEEEAKEPIKKTRKRKLK